MAFLADFNGYILYIILNLWETKCEICCIVLTSQLVVNGSPSENFFEIVNKHNLKYSNYKH
jgi:hypothetical protein